LDERQYEAHSSLRFSKENSTGHERVDEISAAIAVGGARIEHLLDVATIREAHRRSGGVHRKLMQEIASQLALIAGEDRL